MQVTTHNRGHITTPYNLFLEGSSGPAYGNERELRVRLDLS